MYCPEVFKITHTQNYKCGDIEYTLKFKLSRYLILIRYFIRLFINELHFTTAKLSRDMYILYVIYTIKKTLIIELKIMR